MAREIDTQAEVLRAVTLTGAIIAFACAPLVATSDAINIAIAGTLFALGIGLSWISDRLTTELNWGWRLRDIASWVLMALGVVWFAAALWTAAIVQRANEARCLDLQQRMSAEKHDRSDLPVLFQAFGCRPQGYEPIEVSIAGSVLGVE